jgi:hypothetical protein
VKINKRYSWLLFAFFVSIGMSFFMSLVLTVVNLGIVPEFLERWARAFAVAFAVSVPTSLLVIPVVRKIVDKLTAD